MNEPPGPVGGAGPAPGAVRWTSRSLPRLVMTGQAAPADLPGVAPEDAEIWRDPDGAVFALSYVRDGRHRVDLPELVSFVFDRTGEEVRAIPHPPARPELIREVFEHSALPLVLQALGTE